MLCAAAGLPVRRADEVLEVVGLVSLRDERLGTLSRGMDRRLGLACALLCDPHTLVLDDPADGLTAREIRWLHAMLRAHASQGARSCTPLPTPRKPRAPPTASSRWSRAGSSQTRRPPSSPAPGSAPGSPSAARTPHASPPCSPRRPAPDSAPSKSCAREATGSPCTAVPAPTSARPRSATASSCINSPMRSGTWGPARRPYPRRNRKPPANRPRSRPIVHRTCRDRPRTLRRRLSRRWTPGMHRRRRSTPGTPRERR